MSDAPEKQQPATPGTAEAGHSPAYARYVLGVLFVVYVINFIDRQVMSVFIGPIQAEFGVSDTAMGLLVGFAFAVLYTFAGIPIARWADRGNRRTIITIGLALWSAMTVASGLARNFTQLFLARVMVGVGEAAGTPPAHSLIADYFPLNRRATALAIYSAGVFVGAALAYLGGGYLREYFDWRTAFIVLGVPGLVFALVVRFTVREPRRGQSEGLAIAAEADSERPSFGATLRFLLHSRSWVGLIVGSSFLSISGYGILMWGFEFLGRVHGLSPVATGQWMALIVGVGGSLGTYLGGRITDRFIEASPARAMRVPALCTLAAFPCGLVYLLGGPVWLALLGFFPFYVLQNIYIPMMYSVNQSLARLDMRATASAVLLFIINIIGAGAGPFIVGALSDFYAGAHGAASIRYALVTVLISIPAGYVCFEYAARHFRADLQRVRGC
ncbi:MFS transporter [Mangrovimicrobium sediminis]|uniref:MFS transporter n=1 Tax=Mangrovimicrobium sediminis TaxID=2562682 RepID=A0A4Z0LV93_9GAMM|nr:MFS transporter [Haliea sp. SAOS-164]TGD71189.1 MFS transporter [Haliea sp. SAOS-164]